MEAICNRVGCFWCNEVTAARLVKVLLLKSEHKFISRLDACLEAMVLQCKI